MPALATVREPARRQLLGCRPLAGNAPTVALGIEFKNGSVVNKPIDRRDSDGGIGENLAPFAERLIAGDDERAALVALGDQLEQHAGLGLVFADIAEVVEDQAVELVELGQSRRQGEIAPRSLQFLHEIGGAGEQHAIAVVDQPGADRRGRMRLAGAARNSVILPGVLPSVKVELPDLAGFDALLGVQA